ncbi:hypothetical protein ACJMK2_032511, partial [Sinanodonta woodiana]
VINEYNRRNPAAPIVERFKHGKVQAFQKFPDGEKAYCKVFESRSAAARLRLRDRYYQRKIQQHYEAMSRNVTLQR